MFIRDGPYPKCAHDSSVLVPPVHLPLIVYVKHLLLLLCRLSLLLLFELGGLLLQLPFPGPQVSLPLLLLQPSLGRDLLMAHPHLLEPSLLDLLLSSKFLKELFLLLRVLIDKGLHALHVFKLVLSLVGEDTLLLLLCVDLPGQLPVNAVLKLQRLS